MTFSGSIVNAKISIDQIYDRNQIIMITLIWFDLITQSSYLDVYTSRDLYLKLLLLCYISFVKWLQTCRLITFTMEITNHDHCDLTWSFIQFQQTVRVIANMSIDANVAIDITNHERCLQMIISIIGMFSLPFPHFATD